METFNFTIGHLELGEEQLIEGEYFGFDMDSEPGGIHRVQLPYRDFFKTVTKGTILAVQDSNIRLQVDHCGSDHAECLIIIGGKILSSSLVEISSFGSQIN